MLKPPLENSSKCPSNHACYLNVLGASLEIWELGRYLFSILFSLRQFFFLCLSCERTSWESSQVWFAAILTMSEMTVTLKTCESRKVVAFWLAGDSQRTDPLGGEHIYTSAKQCALLCNISQTASWHSHMDNMCITFCVYETYCLSNNLYMKTIFKMKKNILRVLALFRSEAQLL